MIRIFINMLNGFSLKLKFICFTVVIVLSSCNSNLNNATNNKNHAPVLLTDSTSMTFKANLNAIYLDTVHAIDVDGDSLSYRFLSAPKAAKIKDSVISWLTSINDTGLQKFSLIIEDRRGGCDTLNWNVFVNRPPYFMNDTNEIDKAPYIGQSYNLNIVATDKDFDTLHYSCLSKPPTITLNENHLSGNIMNSDTGNYLIAIVVDDSKGGLDTLSWHIHVIPEFVLINAAGQSFLMGSTYADFSGNDNKPAHTVNFTYNFWMKSTEVMQKDFNSISVENNSFFRGINKPVEQVSWYDAILFCNAKSKVNGFDTVYSYGSCVGIPGAGCVLLGTTINMQIKGFRLPTEAEWEYCCRAGTQTPYYWGDTLDPDYLWYGYNSPSGTNNVAMKMPNQFGFYDMCGNVLEWCNDWKDTDGNYYQQCLKGISNPFGPSGGSTKIIRGGSWYLSPGNGIFYFYSSFRASEFPDKSNRNDIGFRIVLPNI